MALDTGQTNASSSAPSGSSKAASFTYPPLFSFPPFFTIQPHPATQSTQLAQWTQLVLKWCAANRVFYLDAARDDPISLWRNSRIQRALGGEGRRTLLTHMVAEENAAWESGAVASAPKSSGGGGSSRLGGSSKANAGLSSSTTTTSKALIYWRKPQEWGDLIYQWVTDTGQGRSILTFYELTEGDLVEGQEFAALPAQMLRLALDTLVAKGKAQIFTGTSSEDQGMEGVKFA